jgi:hypothetical protein
LLPKTSPSYDDPNSNRQNLCVTLLGLSRNPADILSAGKFQVPQTQEFETAMNKEFEQIKAGF